MDHMIHELNLCRLNICCRQKPGCCGQTAKKSSDQGRWPSTRYLLLLSTETPRVIRQMWVQTLQQFNSVLGTLQLSHLNSRQKQTNPLRRKSISSAYFCPKLMKVYLLKWPYQFPVLHSLNRTLVSFTLSISPSITASSLATMSCPVRKEYSPPVAGVSRPAPCKSGPSRKSWYSAAPRWPSRKASTATTSKL